MKGTKRIVAVALALICALGVTIAAPVSAHAYSSAAGITFERAIEIARDAAGGGQVTEVEWALKNGNPRYELEIYHNGRKHEIKIDAVTGDFIKHKSKATSKTKAGMTISQVTSARAMELAEAALSLSGGGTVREIEFELKKGVLICEIEINNNGTKHEVKYNVSTGAMTQHKSKNSGSGNRYSGTINHLAP